MFDGRVASRITNVNLGDLAQGEQVFLLTG